VNAHSLPTPGTMLRIPRGGKLMAPWRGSVSATIWAEEWTTCLESRSVLLIYRTHDRAFDEEEVWLVILMDSRLWLVPTYDAELMDMVIR
jgi:hypothetical protein